MVSPFLTLFAIGFFYTGFFSLVQNYSKSKAQRKYKAAADKDLAGKKALSRQLSEP